MFRRNWSGKVITVKRNHPYPGRKVGFFFNLKIRVLLLNLSQWLLNTWAVINDYIVYTVKRPQPLSTKVTTRNYNMQSRSSLYADVMNHVEEMEVEENLDTPDRYVFTCFVQVHAPLTYARWNLLCSLLCMICWNPLSRLNLKQL